jgi:hypothetical protein
VEDIKNDLKNAAQNIEGFYHEFLLKIGQLRKKQTEITESYMTKLKEAKMEEIRNQIKNYQAK